VAQIISTLYKGDNKGGGGGGDGGGDSNIKLHEACLSFSVAPFVG